MINYRERAAQPGQCADPGREIARLERAIQKFSGQIESAARLADENFGRSLGDILAAQAVIVKDPTFIGEVHQRIEAQMETAEYAACQVLDGYARVFAAMQDDLMQAREADFRDIKNRLLSILAGELPDLEQVPPKSIVVAQQLHVSVLVCLPRKNIAGIVTAQGSAHSHAAILARSAQLPFVIGAGQLVKAVRSGDKLIVDGGAGEVIRDPTPEEISRYRERARQQELVRERLDSHRGRQTVTRDGRKVEVLAELDTLGELTSAMEFSIDGAFVSCDAAEHQQFLAAKALARTLKGRPVLMAAQEVKLCGESPHTREQGGGVANEDELRGYLRALLSASAFGQVAIVLPRVSSAAEVKLARAMLEDCKAALRGQGIPFDPKIRLGALIETPAAAVLAPQIAREADFIVLGVDTLCCHTLGLTAAKRPGESREIFHPAVLRLICRAIKAARRAGIPAVVRGESAADAMMIPFLVGCGAQALCVNPPALWGAREQCENLNYRYWRARVPEILSLAGVSEVIGYLKQNWAERTESAGEPPEPHRASYNA